MIEFLQSWSSDGATPAQGRCVSIERFAPTFPPGKAFQSSYSLCTFVIHFSFILGANERCACRCMTCVGMFSQLIRRILIWMNITVFHGVAF